MTDGIYHGVAYKEQPTQAEEPHIDLTNFACWLELGPPVSTLAGMIDLIGTDLYRRHWPTYGAECKRLAKKIRTTLQYNEEHAEKSSHE